MLIRMTLALSLMLLASSTASAQFGGEFGSGSIVDHNFRGTVESRGILITISNSGKTVTAFSAHSGKIAKISFDKKVEPFVPIVSDSIACFANGKTAYAFSSETGKWDHVEAENKLIQPVVGANMVTFSNGNNLYAFGREQGKWLSVETMKPLAPAIGNGFLKAIDDTKIYICSENSTAWQVIDLQKD